MTSSEVRQHNWAPGPKGNFYGGELFSLLNNPIACLTDLHRKYGGLVRFQKGSDYRYLLVDPQGIKHVLLENQKNYEKSKRYEKMKPLIGNGLITAQGKEWATQRKIAQSFFRPQALTNYQAIIDECCEKLIRRWTGYAETGTPVDVITEMMQLSLNIVGRCFFGTDLSDQTQDIYAATSSVLREMNRRMEMPFEWLKYLTLPQKIRFDQATRNLNRAVHSIIRGRAQVPVDEMPKDLLREMLSLKLEGSVAMNETQIRDHIMTFLLAGHETTATALTWCIYLLCKNPEQALLIRKDPKAPLEEKNVVELALLETLRLYPPVWIFSRQAILADQVLGYDIEPGATINISPYVTHRHPDYWEHPNQFRPGRFLADPGPFEGSYIPFALGGRHCIGSGFAMQEMKTIIQHIFKSFEFELLTSGEAKPKAAVVIRPNLKVRVRIRNLL